MKILKYIPFLLLLSCNLPDAEIEQHIAALGSYEPIFREDNPYTVAKHEYGKRLLKVGCEVNCHKKEFGFTSGSKKFPGGHGTGFTDDGGVNVFDNRKKDFPAVKVLGWQGISFRSEFGASGRFKDAEAQVDSAFAHDLITIDSLQTPELISLFIAAYPSENWYEVKKNEEKLFRLVRNAIAVAERAEKFNIRLFHPVETWTINEKAGALAFFEHCQDCHSRPDFSGPPATIGRPALPFRPDNCFESGIDDDSTQVLRAVPNLINIGLHACYMYDCQIDNLEDAVKAHPVVLNSTQIKNIVLFMENILTEQLHVVQ